MDRIERRGRLATRPNPDTATDYLIVLEAKMTPSSPLGDTNVLVRYVPDRMIVDPGCMDAYVSALEADTWEVLEEVAVAIRDDLLNEVVPRWVQVAVSAPGEWAGVDHHLVVVEDRQPRWDNPALLARVPSAGY